MSNSKSPAKFLLPILLAIGSVQPGAVRAELPDAPAASAPARALAQARSWGYQLQKIDPNVLAGAPYDVLVLDYSRDGTEERALTARELRQIKMKPDGGERIVLAYLSIGEAETYRYYWNESWSLEGSAPAWLGRENKKWRGNIGVRYWDEEWQKIIFTGADSYLDRIVGAGFDGIYLDKVDQYVAAEKEVADARDRMVAFVTALAKRARSLKPGFLVVPQNAEELLSDAEYRAAIDGLGKEDLLFGEVKAKRPNDPEQVEENIGLLKLLTAEGKPVFAVEYIDAPEDIEYARATLEEHGFIPHFAKRSLDRMRFGDLPEPPRKSTKGR
ncbi:MAG TPA: MJ1477/TM1410 family putative glycoside hydrolase [Xanthobacteraceae bacterium]|jgi:cysteinyl-tRNA synthetase